MPEPEKLYNTEAIIQTHHADSEFIKDMISLFLEHIPKTTAELEKANNENNWKKVYFYAHKIKPSIDLFNLNPLKNFIRQLEQKAENELETDTINDDVRFVSDYINKCIAEMKADFNL